MSKEFSVLRKDGYGPHISWPKMMGAARAATKPGHPYQLLVNGKPAGNKRQRYLVLAALGRRTRLGKVGSVYSIRGQNGSVFRTREVAPAIKVINTNGNHKIDIVWSYVREKYPSVDFLGAYVCKDILGSGGTPSQHSYGNALDIGAGSMSALYTIAYDLVRNADKLDLEHVIVDDRIWTRGQGWHQYTGDRHYHVHTDCNPQYSGPCGVRG